MKSPNSEKVKKEVCLLAAHACAHVHKTQPGEGTASSDSCPSFAGLTSLKQRRWDWKTILWERILQSVFCPYTLTPNQKGRQCCTMEYIVITVHTGQGLYHFCSVWCQLQVCRAAVKYKACRSKGKFTFLMVKSLTASKASISAKLTFIASHLCFKNFFSMETEYMSFKDNYFQCTIS